MPAVRLITPSSDICFEHFSSTTPTTLWLLFNIKISRTISYCGTTKKTICLPPPITLPLDILEQFCVILAHLHVKIHYPQHDFQAQGKIVSPEWKRKFVRNMENVDFKSRQQLFFSFPSVSSPKVTDYYKASHNSGPHLQQCRITHRNIFPPDSTVII